ncbi:endonuclease [Rhodococcus sp. SRB_17]|nr:endonuclease [Rhodococcus sp. SRB_17]
MILQGLGIGWRPEIAGIIAQLDNLAFCEVIAESIGSAAPPELERLAVPVIPHGISLSLGGAEMLDPRRIDHLARVAELLDAPMVSEHIAFVRAGGIEAGHLLPVPRSYEALDALTRNITRTQDSLPAPLAVENIAALFDWPDNELTEAEFLSELIERTGVHLVLDIANVYANALNRQRDPWTELSRLPLDHIAYCHIAGGSFRNGRYHDTHTDRVPEPVLEMLTRLTAEGHHPAVMLERDGNYPPALELLDELDAIADAAGLSRITAGTHWSRA